MENDNSLPVHGDSIRSVGAGRGVEWLVGGFKIVFKNPGFWIVGGLILAVASFVLNFIPFIGGALSTALYVVASGAAMRACVAMEEGRDPIPDAQGVLSNTPLLTLGAIAGGLSLVITIIMGTLVAASIGTGMVLGAASGNGMGLATGIGMGLMTGLITMVLFIVLFMALWLAPGLVVFKNVDPITAMKTSLKATLKNLIAYIVLAILSFIAIFLGAIPMGLGLLVVIPATMCAAYLAYREMVG